MNFVLLSDVAKIIMGQSPPSETYNLEGIGLPFFQGKADFGELYPNPRVYCSQPIRIAEPGDILISVRAPVGPTNVSKTRSCIGRGLSAIRSEKSIDADYLLYFLRYFEPILSIEGTGSTFDAIAREDLEQIKVPLPRLTEQKRIADILQKADRIRRLRRFARQLSDGYLQSVFLEMFGDIGYQREVSFSEVVKIDRKQATEHERSSLPYIGLEDIVSNQGILTKGYTLTPKIMLATNYKFTLEHILYGKLRPYLNKVLLPSFDGTCSTEILPLLPKENKILRTYLATYLMSNHFVEWASKNVEGANLPRLSPDALSNYPIPVPHMEDQERFDAIYLRIKTLQQRFTESERQAEHLFQSLLHQAFEEQAR